MGQVEWVSSKTPLSQSHPVPPNLKTDLSQSHPVPPNLKTPLSQSHPVPPIMETPLSQSHLSHVLKSVSTCLIWLYHLSFPSSLFSGWFSDFLRVSDVILFFEKHLWLKSFLQSTTMLKSVNNQQISTKRPQKTVTRHTPEHMGMFCL